MYRLLRITIIFVTLGLAAPAYAADWNLTFVGDIMLDRNVRTEIRSKGFEPLVAKIKSEFTGDAVIANLEGPFTNSTKHAVPGGSLLFTFEPYVAKKLRAAGITTVSLANNHTLNQGFAGLSMTRTTLKKAGIEYFGDPLNRHAYRLVQHINGTRIAYVGHHGLVSGLDTILKDIRSAKTFADVVIVFAHEGTEYQLNFTKRQQQDYRKMIDAGATMVIGAHPHVVEPIEIYKGKFIAYSLGNFLFDQYFSADTQQGLLLHISGTGSTPKSVQFVPIQSQRSVVRPASPTIRTNMLRRISQNSIASASIKSQLKTGTIRLP